MYKIKTAKEGRMNYNKLREWLSEIEHDQWTYWSKSIANDLVFIANHISLGNYIEALNRMNNKIKQWKKNWKPYKKLKEDVKDYDRVWADLILNNMPFKCPVYQCGGIMVSKERAYPKGMNEDDFPDGMAGDYQLPDLICTNCKAVYEFKKFNNRKSKRVVIQSENKFL